MPENRQECVEHFFKECFEQENRYYQEKVLKNASANVKEYIEQFRSILRQFMQQVEKVQILNTVPVSCIEISLLRNSMDSDNLRFCFEAFDMDGHSGNPILSLIIELNWFANEQKELKSHLETARKQIKWARFVKPEDIRMMLQDTIYEILAGLYFFFKYAFDDVREWKEYSNIMRTELFFLSMGEYHDWQKNLFVDRPEFDIFMLDGNASLRYGKFLQMVYKDKDFSSLDLKGSTFENCKFIECTFSSTEFKDCKFVDCEFVFCREVNADFSGSMILRTNFRGCDLSNTKWLCNPIFPVDTFEDLYRRTKIYDSHFYNSKIVEEKISICDIQGTEFLNELEE